MDEAIPNDEEVGAGGGEAHSTLFACLLEEEKHIRLCVPVSYIKWIVAVEKDR